MHLANTRVVGRLALGTLLVAAPVAATPSGFLMNESGAAWIIQIHPKTLCRATMTFAEIELATREKTGNAIQIDFEALDWNARPDVFVLRPGLGLQIDLDNRAGTKLAVPFGIVSEDRKLTCGFLFTSDQSGAQPRASLVEFGPSREFRQTFGLHQDSAADLRLFRRYGEDLVEPDDLAQAGPADVVPGSSGCCVIL